MQGWLRARGAEDSAQWERNWCVLDSQALRSYTDESCKDQCGEVEIFSSTVAVPFTSAKPPGDAAKYATTQPHGFVVDPDPSFRLQKPISYFDAEEAEALAAWIQAIQDLAAKKTSPSPSNAFRQHVRGAHGFNQTTYAFNKCVSIWRSRSTGAGKLRDKASAFQDWTWTNEMSQSADATGFSGAQSVLATFLARCKENGLPEDKYVQLVTAMRDLIRRPGVSADHDHFEGEENTVDVLASAGVLSTKKVAQLFPKQRRPTELKEYMTQAEMLDLFKERIMEDGQIMHKTEPAMIRPAVKGEKIVTKVDGRVTSDVEVKDESSWVVRAPTVHQEEYVLNQSKFDANWNGDGEPPRELGHYTNPVELEKQGFKLHYPKLVLKWTYEIQAADLEFLPSRTLQTEWGAMQTVVSGDYLALPYPEAKGTEIYIMPQAVVKGVYRLYEASMDSRGSTESIAADHYRNSQVLSKGTISRMLKTHSFDRRTRGDIRADTQALVQGLEEPYNLLFRYQMQQEVLVKWIQAIAEQYNQVEYHSWHHAFDVFQFIYSCLTIGTSDKYFRFQDILALLLGALSHDVGHMGTTNNFHILTESELATRYNDKSPLENMHASVFFQTLQKPGLNFLAAMSTENFRDFRSKVVDSILATDMSHHFELIDKVSVRVDQATKEDMPIVTAKDEVAKSDGDLKMLLQTFMHMADLGHCARPFDVHKHIVVLLEEEFFKQGDQEMQLGMPVSPMMDRSKDSAATSQSFFLTKLVLPLMKPWTFFLASERANLLLEALQANKEEWESLCSRYIPAEGQKKTAKEIVAAETF